MTFNPLKAIRSVFQQTIHDELEKREETAAKSIRLELQLRARASTVDYVESRMAHVESVAGRLKLLEFAFRSRKPNGLICEFGVFSGTSVNFLARLTSTTVYGFDSFQGLPERWIDGFPAGHFGLQKPPPVRSNVTLVTGWFHETLPAFVSEHSELLSFLHVDCDLFSSTQTVLTHLKLKFQVGTVIVFDDYFNYPGWQDGEFKAFQEFILTFNFAYEYLGYNRDDEQVAIIITELR